MVPAALLAASLVAAGGAFADPAGKTTLEETIQPGTGTGFSEMRRGPGETYVVRRLGTRPDPDREDSRRSLAFFGQLTDPQIADEMSPARADFLDPAGGPALTSSHRAHEALGPHTFDQIVRNMNANRTSPVDQGNDRNARLQFAITTGDMADSQQENETRWFIGVLNGGRVDPMSGKTIGPANPCPGASQADIARLNADVAARRYTGVQDYDDYPGEPAARYAGFWDPDAAAPTSGMYDGFPRYPGLLDEAQQTFTAQGLRVPWYNARGNHDGLIGGQIVAKNPIFRAIVSGCQKVFPDDSVDPAQFEGVQGNVEFFRRLNSDPAFIQQLLSIARRVPPDPDRRFLTNVEYKQMHGRADRGHGYRFVDRREQRASDGSAAYYAYTKRGIRFISLDTVAEGGGSSGNLDNPQFRWLQRELRRAERRDQLVVTYGHHTLGTMNNPNTNEAAGACSGANDPGCDEDPRRSTPIHNGLTGRNNLRNLFLRYPHMIAYVAGHTHENDINRFARRGRGFWEINTASHTDFPQESRVIEIMDNRDGTLSIFGTILDHASPIDAPNSGTAAGAFNLGQLGSISRLVAANDPQRRSATGETGDSGTRQDRNVELLLRDPRD